MLKLNVSCILTVNVQILLLLFIMYVAFIFTLIPHTAKPILGPETVDLHLMFDYNTGKCCAIPSEMQYGFMSKLTP